MFADNTFLLQRKIDLGTYWYMLVLLCICVCRYVTVKIMSVVKDSSMLAVSQFVVQSVAMRLHRPKT